MAVPKHKTSKQRTHTRRSANRNIDAPTLVACPKCGEMIPTHRACSHCGYYKGESIIQIKQDKED